MVEPAAGFRLYSPGETWRPRSSGGTERDPKKREKGREEMERDPHKRERGLDKQKGPDNTEGSRQHTEKRAQKRRRGTHTREKRAETNEVF